MKETVVRPRVSNTTLAKSVPKPVLIGGLVLGVVAIPVISYVLIAALGLAITTVKLGVIGLLIFAFVYMWPVILKGLYTARSNMDDAITRADPATALKLKKQEFARVINERRQLVADAAGALGVYKRTFEENKSSLSEERKQHYIQNIEKREQAVGVARTAVKKLEKEYARFEEKIQEAEAELRLAEADKQLAGSLAKTGDVAALSDTTRVALDEITRRVESAAMQLDMVLEDASE